MRRYHRGSRDQNKRKFGDHMSVIQAKGIVKAYGLVWKKKILDSISISINSGECTCIVGENGAGKSTLIKILAEIIPKDEGQFHFSGTTSYVPEISINYASMNAEENMIYYDRITGEHENFNEYIEKFALPIRGKSVKNFSKGMKRKLDLVRALNINPAAILLDEPFEGLDPLTCSDIIDMLKEEKKKGKAILMSSHDMSYIERVADSIFLLRNGRLREYSKAWKSNHIIIIDGDKEAVCVILGGITYSIKQQDHYYGISIDESYLQEALDRLRKSKIKIIRQEVESLEEAYLREIKKVDN